MILKTLYLVRHAKSSWDYPELTDFERPLSQRGERNAPDMGKYLINQGVLADLLLSSPANRALSTAKVISKEIGYMQEIVTDKRIYHAAEKTLLDVLNKQDESLSSIMMLGHNPGFTDFANRLTGGYIDNIPTCGACQIDFPIDKWKDVTFGLGEMIFFQYPKGLS